jgi:hypothetical protein
LHRQLGLSESEVIPIGILEQIKRAKIGTHVSFRGKHLVTRLLKRRAVFAGNIRRKR